MSRLSALQKSPGQSLFSPLFQRLLQLLVLAAFLFSGFAMAQGEPTIKQIYESAQSGKLDEAQTMIQQVLISHPSSARAHYVQAELFARQGLAAKGRESLATAEKLAPGLPFAKAEAVSALRTQLNARAGAPAAQKLSAGDSSGSAAAASSSSSGPSFSLGLGLALGGAAIAAAIFFLRKKPVLAAQPYAPQNTYTPPVPAQGAMIGSGLSGPQTFGTAAPAYGQAYGQGYGQGYGQNYGGQPYPQQQPAGSGLGGRVMGGLATGLAVGAGVMAAQAIGKSLTSHDEQPHVDGTSSAGGGSHSSGLNDGFAGHNLDALPGNRDMGGDNFGISDSGSWDGGDAGGGDWDV